MAIRVYHTLVHTKWLNWNARRLLAWGLWVAPAGLVALSAFADPPPAVPVQTPTTEQPVAADGVASELDRRFRDDVEPLLARYCLKCHTGDEPKGDVLLDNLRGVHDAITGDFDLRLMKELVGGSEMPPKEKPQPTDLERLIITQWIDAVLAYVPEDAPIDPGWFTIHRLNRTEYRNTLRDLLGIDPSKVDLAAKLPRDDMGYGFDNIADVLSTSPLAIEQYLDAAERAIDSSLGPPVEFGDHPRPTRLLTASNGTPLPRGGRFLYSNGSVTAKINAPLTGEYMIRINAWETPAGDERSRMRLKIGSRTVKEFSVSGAKGSAQECEARVRLDAGEHVIAATFLNDYYVKDKADRNLAIESISVAGPLDEATADRSPQWSRVFVTVPGTMDENARAESILQQFATRAYRRPATSQQVASLLRVYNAERQAGKDFEPAVRTALTATLVSPHFLFRSVAHPDAANPSVRYKLDGYELANRLSYFLWSSMPDERLLSAATDGSLVTDAGLVAQVKRMLRDDRSAAFIDNFSGQWLQLRALDSIAIDRARFPEYDDTLRAAMKTEASMFFGDVLRSDLSVLEFIQSKTTFLNQKLAAFYGVPGVKGDAFRRVTLPEGSARGGVLTMGAILTLTSNTTRTSPVKRGLFVLDQMLGAPPPPPPPDIPPLEQSSQTSPDATVRERLAAHVAVASCAACHNRLDPIGLTFENFDAIGRWRDSENGKPVDASGTLPGNIQLDGSQGLKRNLMSRSDQFVEALTGKLMTYALGRGMEPFDRPAIHQIAIRTRANGDRLSAMIESIVMSESFRSCRGRKPSHE